MPNADRADISELLKGKLPTGSRVTVSLKFAGPLAGVVTRFSRGLTERYLALEAEGLKARAEGAAAPSLSHA